MDAIKRQTIRNLQKPIEESWAYQDEKDERMSQVTSSCPDTPAAHNVKTDETGAMVDHLPPEDASTEE